MLPDSVHPIFSLADSPPYVNGTTHLLPLLCDSYKHIALFIIADHALHEPHPLFQRFVDICRQHKRSVRPAILARTYRIGGLRRPDWSESDDNILFLATDSSKTEQGYGLNGKEMMGLLIIRPDAYVTHSTRIELDGTGFQSAEAWLEANLVISPTM